MLPRVTSLIWVTHSFDHALIRHNQTTFNILISKLSYERDVEAIEAAIDDMRALGFEPDGHTRRAQRAGPERNRQLRGQKTYQARPQQGWSA